MESVRTYIRVCPSVDDTAGRAHPVSTFEPIPNDMSEKTLFQKIADGEIPSDMVHQDEHCIAFRDIQPQAPVHILIVPRKPIPSLDDLTSEDQELMGHLFLCAREIAASEGLEKGYRTVFNCGEHGQQTVPHLHLHLIGGRQLRWPPG